MRYTYEGPNLFLNPRVVVFLPDIHRATRPWGNLTAHKQYPLSRHKHYMDFFACRHAECTGGLVAEYNPATVETRVRFPVGASCFVFHGRITCSRTETGGRTGGQDRQGEGEGHGRTGGAWAGGQEAQWVDGRCMGKKSTSAGFEPARAMPNRFLVYRLNRSATTCASVATFPYLNKLAPRRKWDQSLSKGISPKTGIGPVTSRSSVWSSPN